MGFPFHIPSATVSPNPSARLFWTITVADRWRALTIRGILIDIIRGEGQRTDAVTGVRWQSFPCCNAFLEYLGALGIIGDSLCGRPDEKELCINTANHGRGEAGHDTVHVFQPIPSRHLHDEVAKGPRTSGWLPRLRLDGPLPPRSHRGARTFAAGRLSLVSNRSEPGTGEGHHPEAAGSSEKRDQWKAE